MDDNLNQELIPRAERNHVSKSAVISAALAALIPALTGAAYLTGLAYHRGYLETFKVPYGIMNKSTTDYFLCAHKAIVALLVAFTSNSIVIVVAIALFLSLCGWAIMNKFDQRLGRHPKVRKLRSRAKESAHLRLFGEVLGLPALSSLLFLYVLFVLTFVLILPGVLGEAAGRLDAKSVQAAIEGGCGHPHGTYMHCTDIMHDGHQLARGFILDASDKHVFLVADGITKVLPIGDNSFVTVSASATGIAH
jgi:hypothetical protein